MPTSQVSSNGAGGVQPLIENVVAAIRPPPPPSKLPPPPPPPKNNRPLPVVPTLQTPPPPPPPPPPPRNSSQIGGNLIPIPPNIPLHNNVTSVNSPGGCVGRCSGRGGANSNGIVGMHPPTPNQRGFTRHGECGSRSSVSSHSSMSHHYHGPGACHGPSSNNISAHVGPVVHCNHQPSPGGCAWSAVNQSHGHVNSGSVSDNGKCNMYHDQGVGCCSHQPTVPNKFQSQTSVTPSQTTTISRSTLYPNELDTHHTHEPHCNGDHPPQMMNQALHHHNHHHHHHNHHHELLSHSEQATQDQSAIPIINDGHRCINSGTNLEPVMATQPCCHTHKPHTGCAHQPAECCEHHGPTNITQQQQLSSTGPHHNHCSGSCGSHSHSNGTTLHHECNTNTPIISKNNLGVSGDSCVHGRHHHHHHHHHPGQCPNHHAQVRPCQDSFNNGVSPSSITAHVHNLSNSSTTTHTSNVAVKQQQLQFHHHQNHGPTLSRAARSSSSQHYEQYGLSSAASTSSATASLSSYQTRAGYEDVAGGLPSYPSSRFHQPLPPPPPSTTTLPFYHHHALASAKSQPASPSNQMFVNHNHNAGPLITLAPTTINSNVPSQNGQHPSNYQQQQQPQHQHQHQQQTATQQQQQQLQLQGQQLPPPPPPVLSPHSTLQLHISQHPLPPLPPKPVSPNASSCSTQITTVRTSPVTRITSHAGLEGPIPDSDVPPPPPPLKHGSRIQPLVNALSKMTLNEDGINGSIGQQQPPLEPLLNYSRGGIITDAARKTEDIARQVEMDIEQRRRTSGQPLGVCGICKTNVMPLQAACEAENQIFHTNCFVCFECGRPLQGKKYYPVGDKAYCEEDFEYSGHMKSLEKCAACGQPIFDMILPALNKFYHPNCFKCCICNQCLDGVPFTIDKKNNIYCVRDYHNIHSPKCAKCGKPISPIDGTSETVRVVSMGKDYHVDCYCCEDCGLQLTDEEPSRCFPLDNHLLCQTCHINRLTATKPALSLN